MDSLRDNIKEIIVGMTEADENNHYYRIPLVAFARGDDPLFAEIVRVVGPVHLKPEEILPEVKTVISFYLPFSAEVGKTNQGDGPVSRVWGLSYLAANTLFNSISEKLIDRLSYLGYKTGTVPATYGFDAETLKACWSHRSAAFVAGLGRFGLNRMLIGPAGGTGRYGTVFTEAEIPASERPTDDLCIYFKNGKCKVCLKACPVEALSEDGFDGQKCYAHVLKNSDYLDLDGRLCDVCGKCAVSGPCAMY